MPHHISLYFISDEIQRHYLYRKLIVWILATEPRSVVATAKHAKIATIHRECSIAIVVFVFGGNLKQILFGQFGILTKPSNRSIFQETTKLHVTAIVIFAPGENKPTEIKIFNHLLAGILVVPNMSSGMGSIYPIFNQLPANFWIVIGQLQTRQRRLLHSHLRNSLIPAHLVEYFYVCLRHLHHIWRNTRWCLPDGL